MARRQVWAPDVADEQCVPSEYRPRRSRFIGITYHQTDAFRRVPRGLQDADHGLPKLQFEAIADGNVIKNGTGLRTHINSRSGAGGQLFVSGDKICMQMALENMSNGDT